MDEMIEITAEKVRNSISGWGWADQAYMLNEIADKLREFSSECLSMEFSIPDEIE